MKILSEIVTEAALPLIPPPWKTENGEKVEQEAVHSRLVVICMRRVFGRVKLIYEVKLICTEPFCALLQSVESIEAFKLLSTKGKANK